MDLYPDLDKDYKKRGRAQSAEPTPAHEIQDPLASGQEATAPKKSKRDDENKPTVSTIRKNMKDMSTTDRTSTGTAAENSSSTSTNNNDGSQEDADEDLDENDEIPHVEKDDEPMGTIVEQEETEQNTSGSNSNPFAGNTKDEDDWGEFAEEEEETTKLVNEETSNTEEKPKYTFGASSGFGTKDWAATHQTIPTPSKAPTFGGFGSSSGFGGFKSATAPSLTSTSTTDTSSPFKAAAAGTTSIPSFGSFAKATTSPFASAPAAGNALTSTPSNDNQSSNSPALSSTSADHNNNKDNTDDESDQDKDRESSIETSHAAFGEGAKVKVPGVKQQTEVKTGEEDEDTVYQVKGKLLVLDAGNWKERGVGTLRINCKAYEDYNQKPAQARLVMRTDTVYRLILNLLLFEGMKVFLMQEKFVRFSAFETEPGTSEPKLVSYALRLGSPQAARKLLEEINAHIPHSTTNANA